MVDAWDDLKIRAEQSMVRGRWQAWIDEKRERGYLNYWVEQVAAFKIKKNAYDKSLNMN